MLIQSQYLTHILGGLEDKDFLSEHLKKILPCGLASAMHSSLRIIRLMHGVPEL